MEYRVIVPPATGFLSRHVGQAATEFTKELNQQITLGRELVGGVADGPAGTHLRQALVRCR